MKNRSYRSDRVRCELELFKVGSSYKWLQIRCSKLWRKLVSRGKQNVTANCGPLL